MQVPANFTQLLTEWRSGHPQALEQLTPLIYDELRRLAHSYIGYASGRRRQPAAFAGYDQGTITYSYLRQDDFYTFDHGINSREAITARVGVSTR